MPATGLQGTASDYEGRGGLGAAGQAPRSPISSPVRPHLP